MLVSGAVARTTFVVVLLVLGSASALVVFGQSWQRNSAGPQRNAGVRLMTPESLEVIRQTAVQQSSKLARDDVKQAAASMPVQPSSQLERALELAYKARRAYQSIRGYTCIFIKRERINGILGPMEFIRMKVRTQPFSIYMQWLQPHTGREVIYVHGRYGNKLLAHDTGAKKIIAGTVELDPQDPKLLKYSRHPITEAGIGNMIAKLIRHWEAQRRWPSGNVVVLDNARVDTNVCWCVKCVHPRRSGQNAYYRIRVFFDKRTELPIRCEGYEWPLHGDDPNGLLAEEYTYRNLRTDVVLSSWDFSPHNPRYNFGRF